jgi:hypothetical protein
MSYKRNHLRSYQSGGYGVNTDYSSWKPSMSNASTTSIGAYDTGQFDTSAYFNSPSTSSSTSGAGGASAGVGYAAGAANIIGGLGSSLSPDPYGQGPSSGTSQALNSTMDTVGSNVGGPWYALGKGVSSGFEAGRNEGRKQGSSAGAGTMAFFGGLADPAGSWGDIVGDRDSGNVSTGQALGGMGLNLLFPGAGDAYLEPHRAKAANRNANPYDFKRNVGGTNVRFNYNRGNAITTAETGGQVGELAELEGKEVIEHANGSGYTKVYGEPHSRGGVKKRLNKGDYIWSTHLGFSDKAMKTMSNGGDIEGLRYAQELKAGRIPKYQNGGFGTHAYMTRYLTPYMAKEANILPAATASAPKTYRTPMRGQNKQVTPEMVKLSQDIASGLREPKGAPTPTVGPIKEEEAVEGGTDKGRVSGATIARYALPALGAAAQLPATIAAFGRKPIYTKHPGHVSHRDINLRTINPYERLSSNKSDFHALVNSTKRSGLGPGTTSALLAAYRAKQSGDAQIQDNVNRTNIEIGNREAMMNSQHRNQMAMFNRRNDMQIEQDRAAADARTEDLKLGALQNLGQTIAGITSDASAILSDEEQARAYAGSTGVMRRFDRFNYEQFKRKNPGLSEQEALEAFMQSMS